KDEGTIGAGCQRGDCKTDINAGKERLGIGAWKQMRRLMDEDYAAKAEAAERQDTLLGNLADMLRNASRGETPRTLTEADIFNPDEKTENPLDELTYTKDFADVSYDDTSNALRVAEHYGRYLRFVQPSTGLILWTGDVWKPNSAKLVRAYAQ